MQSTEKQLLARLEANLERPRDVIQEPACWPDDGTWHFAFLKELGHDRHILPPMVGLGSSFFYGRTPSPGTQTHRRFEMVEPRDARATFIKEAVSEYPKVFGADERAAIATKVHCELTPHPVCVRFNP